MHMILFRGPPKMTEWAKSGPRALCFTPLLKINQQSVTSGLLCQSCQWSKLFVIFCVPACVRFWANLTQLIWRHMITMKKLCSVGKGSHARLCVTLLFVEVKVLIMDGHLVEFPYGWNYFVVFKTQACNNNQHRKWRDSWELVACNIL